MVEDDRAILYLFTHVLQKAGYAVIACQDGTRGFATACEQIEGIDAVISDALMPGLSGQDLIARIRALRPQLPAILVTGSIEDGAGPAAGDPATVRLFKPVSPDRLRRELRRLLTRSGAGGAARPAVR